LKNSRKVFFWLFPALLLLGSFSLWGADFAPVVPGRIWNFPRDHGAHPEFKTEWWYFTGHLRDANGRVFGFQWTVFRNSLPTPESLPAEDRSAWRSGQVYLGHLALSDLKRGQFYYEESAARDALGMASASTSDFQVQLPGFSGGSQDKTWKIHGTRGPIVLDLSLNAPPQVVFHGEAGYSPKSQEAGYASYYYSIPVLPAKGTVQLLDQSWQVEGVAWMDHEFGSGKLAPNQSGWDWMGLPLGGKSALMIYRLRDRLDRKGDFLSGTYIDSSGISHRLQASELRLTPSQEWTSPRSRGVYPLKWLVEIPAYGVNLTVSADFADQELETRRSTQVTYWEGSVSIGGKVGSETVQSQGYLEMTGYGKD